MNLLELIFPKTCVGCAKPGQYICKDCKKTIKIHPEICPICHKNSIGGNVCKNCKSEEMFFEGIFICFNYENIIKKIVLGLKYRHLFDLAGEISQRIGLFLESNRLQKENTIITYVPSHWTRKHLIKGYNQSELLAKELAKTMGIKMKHICKKTKLTKSQTGLKRNQRLINLKGAFEINQNLDIKGNENILIIDDITTTGASINELAKTIKFFYPAAKVYGVALARNNNG